MIAQAPLSSYTKTTQFRRGKLDQTESDLRHKFMQTIGIEVFKELDKSANEKRIGVQTLLRAVIIPEWVQREGLSIDANWNPTAAQTSNRERRGKDRAQEF